jgi:hypothetical protein
MAAPTDMMPIVTRSSANPLGEMYHRQMVIPGYGVFEHIQYVPGSGPTDNIPTAEIQAWSKKIANVYRRQAAKTAYIAERFGVQTAEFFNNGLPAFLDVRLLR